MSRLSLHKWERNNNPSAVHPILWNWPTDCLQRGTADRVLDTFWILMSFQGIIQFNEMDLQGRQYMDQMWLNEYERLNSVGRLMQRIPAVTLMPGYDAVSKCVETKSKVMQLGAVPPKVYSDVLLYLIRWMFLWIKFRLPFYGPWRHQSHSLSLTIHHWQASCHVPFTPPVWLPSCFVFGA